MFQVVKYAKYETKFIYHLRITCFRVDTILTLVCKLELSYFLEHEDLFRFDEEYELDAIAEKMQRQELNCGATWEDSDGLFHSV